MSRVSTVTAPTKSAQSSQPTLRQGSRGSAVVSLQKKLSAAGFNPGAADGDFGPKTLAAVKAFQRSKGLAADGVVGPKTWAKLGVQGASATTSSSSGGTTVTGYVNGVAKKITLKAIPNGKYLRSDAAAAFNKMSAAAKSAGVTLPVVSGFRSMAQQKNLYALYLQGRGNLAAKPGYSNHQGGIAVDISVGSTASKTYKWLAANASKYGFKRTVPSEPWHWEYRR
ncbi:MAG: D-alanyl-D-alanine carboxypeptidase family protein [Myxococcaceae bacterium]